MKIGHVHLKVAELSRAEAFYRALLGATVTERVDGVFAFLSMGEAHHELALQAIGAGAPVPAPGSVGLYHTAFEVPGPAQLREAVDKLEAMRVEYSLVDHGISWALYTADPDGHGVEIYVDRRRHSGGAEFWRGRSRVLSRQDLVGG